MAAPPSTTAGQSNSMDDSAKSNLPSENLPFSAESAAFESTGETSREPHGNEKISKKGKRPAGE